MTQHRKKDPMPKMCLHCDADTADLIRRIAASEGITVSECIRNLLHRAIDAEALQEDEAQLQAKITASVREVIKPYIERLAAISAKSAQISGASFFMDALLFSQLFPESNRDAITQAAVKARGLGGEYMNLRSGEELDAFVQKVMEAAR